MRSDRMVRGTPGRWRRVAVMLAVVAVAVTASCMPKTTGQPDMIPEPVEPTRLRVDNRAFLDMNIFVYRSSQRIRLGTATGNSVTRFTIPANLLFGSTPLRFQADPIGGSRASMTQEITVTPGDEVALEIPPT